MAIRINPVEGRHPWDYKVVHLRGSRQEPLLGGDAIESELNRLGTTEWGLVGLYDERAILKRITG